MSSELMLLSLKIFALNICLIDKIFLDINMFL